MGPDWEHPVHRSRRCAIVEGYSLHANAAVEAHDRRGLERLLCYGMRPAFCSERLELRDDGKVVYRLKRPWPRPGGISELVMDPLDFLRRLCCLIPPPRRHLTRYYGVFAPHSRLRGRLPPSCPLQPSTGVQAGSGSQLSLDLTDGSVAEPEGPPTLDDEPDHLRPPGVSTPSGCYRMRWSSLLRRVFDIDVLRCEKCGGRRVIVSFITDPPVVRRILAHVGLPTEAPVIAPARDPPQVEMGWSA